MSVAASQTQPSVHGQALPERSSAPITQPLAPKNTHAQSGDGRPIRETDRNTGPPRVTAPPLAKIRPSALCANAIAGDTSPRLLARVLSCSDREVVEDGADESAELAARRCFAALLRLDASALESAAELAPRLAAGASTPGASLWATLARHWAELANGQSLEEPALTELERRARELRLAELVVTSASLRALAQAERDSFSEAVENARRAWRMARTEGLPEPEHLAGLTLARLRRQTGRAYLSARIAGALRRIASPTWHAWIDWELVLARGHEAVDSAPIGPARDVKALIEHANTGDRVAFDVAAERVETATRGLAPFSRDARRLLTALDPGRAAPKDDSRLLRWITGVDALLAPPYGLAGVEPLGEPSTSPAAGALVVATPDRPGRRVLHIARGLAASQVDGRFLEDGPSGRPESVLSALALAGPTGLEDAELFRAVYGFAYVAALHRGTFDVAVHRARARLADFGDIERSKGRMCLRVRAPFGVVDPRSTAGIDDRVLALVASTGELSARDAAKSLGVPLRTVQGSLRDLVDSGACRPQRDGRRVVYCVEDTTFQEPTRTRPAATEHEG